MVHKMLSREGIIPRNHYGAGTKSLLGESLSLVTAMEQALNGTRDHQQKRHKDVIASAFSTYTHLVNVLWGL